MNKITKTFLLLFTIGISFAFSSTNSINFNRELNPFSLSEITSKPTTNNLASSTTIEFPLHVNSISRNDNEITNADEVSYTVTFNEIIETISPSDFTISGTTAHISVSGNMVSKNTYSFSYIYQLSLLNRQLQNVKVSINQKTTSFNQNLTTLRQRIALNQNRIISDPNNATYYRNLIAGLEQEIIDITTQHNKDIAAYTQTSNSINANLDYYNSKLSLINSAGSSTFFNAVTVTISGGDLADLNNTITLSIKPNNTILANTGETLKSTTPISTNNNTYTIDNPPPASIPNIESITRQNPTNQKTTNASVTFQVIFSETVDNVDVTDFALDSNVGGTITSVSNINNKTYHVNIAGLSGAGTIALRVKGVNGTSGSNNIVSLAAENPLDTTAPSTSESYIKERPVELISISRQNPTNQSTTNSSVSFRVLFSENVTNVDLSDFNLDSNAGGSISSVSAINTKTYDVNITGLLESGTVSLEVKGVATASGINNITSISTGNLLTSTAPITNESYIKTPPLKVIAITRQNPINQTTTNSSITFRVLFSENVVNVDISDFYLDSEVGGTINSVSSIDDKTYDVFITGLSESGTISLNIKGAGNTNGTTNITNTSSEKKLTATAPTTTESYIRENEIKVISSNNSLHFDGVNDYVSIANNNQKFNYSNGFTAEAWVKTDALGTQQTILSHYHSDYYSPWYLYIHTNGSIRYGIRNIHDTNHSGQTSEQLTANTWYHIALIADPANSQIQLLINGSVVQTRSFTGTIIESNNNLHIGRLRSGDPRLLKGSIDEVRFWNKPLSVTEINNQKDCFVDSNSSNLIAYYNFNQGIPNGSNSSILSVDDTTSNELHGILNNFSRSGTSSNFVVSNLPCNSCNSATIDSSLTLNSITRNHNETTNLDQVSYTITFNEIITDISPNDFITSGTTAYISLSPNMVDKSTYTNNYIQQLHLLNTQLLNLKTAQATRNNLFNNKLSTLRTSIIEAEAKIISNPSEADNQRALIAQLEQIIVDITLENEEELATYNTSLNSINKELDYYNSQLSLVSNSAASYFFNSVTVTLSGGDLPDLDNTIMLCLKSTNNIASITGEGLKNTTPTDTNNNTYTINNTSLSSTFLNKDTKEILFFRTGNIYTLKAPFAVLKVDILSFSGEKVFTTNRTSFNPDISKGLYILKIKTEKGFLFKKVML